MRDLLEVCCGLDIHKEMIVACLLKGGLDTEPEAIVREYSTLISGLEQLKNWIVESDCKHIAMESTGVYWFPIYNVLESAFEEVGDVQIIVTNPRHMKNVPGKKTDIKDARWIAGLLRAGLLESSYIPPRLIRELRDWTRYRKTIVQEMTGHKNRIEKFLQQCGFKLSSVLSDIFGASGMALVRHLSQTGSISAEEAKMLLKGTAKSKSEAILQAINGKLSPHEQSFLNMLLEIYDHSLCEIAKIEAKIDLCAEKFDSAISLLETIPGVQRIGAITVISEIGTDVSMFPSAGNLCSWAGMCPVDNESAGKRKSTRLAQGNIHLKNVLCQTAWAVTRCKNTYLREWFWRLQSRRGMKKAVIALGRKLLVIIWNMLLTGEIFSEARYTETKMRMEEHQKQRLATQAKRLGLIVVPA